MSAVHTAKRFAKRILPRVVAGAARALRGRRGVARGDVPGSTNYEVLAGHVAPGDEFGGWREAAVAERQHAAYSVLLGEMKAGNARRDLVVAAEAVERTGLPRPLVVEIGCGSGYYSEVLAFLCSRPVHYAGVDYSPAMVCLAARSFPGRPFVVGDAVALPIADRTFDIVLNGVSLMHILDYEEAIRESRRVTRQWCILHTVPVLRKRRTTVLRKMAYGRPTVEVVFNESELVDVLTRNGLAVRETWDSIEYDLESVLGERTTTRTYLCEATEC